MHSERLIRICKLVKHSFQKRLKVLNMFCRRIINLRGEKIKLNKKAVAWLKFANSSSKFDLFPITLNSTINNKAENSLKYLYIS